MGAEGGAPVSPSIQTASLVQRLTQDVAEVKNALEANELLRRDLSDAQAACERLEKSNSSLRNARAMQKARLATLEHENANLKNINTDSEQKSERIKALERDCHQLQELNTSLEDEHKVKISTLKRERFGLKIANAKLEEDKVALDQKLRDADARLIEAKNAAEIAESEKVRICQELEEERSKTMQWKNDYLDLHGPHGIIVTLNTELFEKMDRLATMEEQTLKLRKELEMAAERQDAHVAASRKASELGCALSGLRTLLSAERATSQEALNATKESKELLNQSKKQCSALEEAAQARESSNTRERQHAMMYWSEQTSRLNEESAYELAWTLHICTQHEQDAEESRRKIAVEREETARTRRKLEDYQKRYRDMCDDLKWAKHECSEQREYQRQYLSTTDIPERERSKLRRDLADLAQDRKRLETYSRKLERDLKTLSSTTKEALKEKTEQLRAAENEKATCDRIMWQLTEQASNREKHVNRLSQALVRKQVRKRYIGTEKLTQAESDLYFDARDCCESSSAFEVRVHGCLLPSGFAVSTAAIVSSDPRSLGCLEEGHRIEGEDLQVPRNVSWILTKHGGIEEAIQQWKEHEAAMQQEAEQKDPGDPSKFGKENYATAATSRESTRLSLQRWKAPTGLAEVAREAGSERTGKPQASTSHLLAASNPSQRRCEAESIVSRPEVTLSNPNSPISPREPTASTTLPHTGRPTASAAQYAVGGDNAQTSPRDLFPHPRSRQASRDELGYGQVSRDPCNAQKRPCSDEKNGSTDNRPPWNAPKRPRFFGYSRT
ncbi:hypothetical protein KC331_g8616 [Hortaea werneckii]|nr:hypothetical protein KC331_g8616 [Hortaea werneckii]KAI7712730.1 hypothetical protein KC353_g8064 [Hortaea werneckii]